VLTPSSTTLSFGSVYVNSSMAQPLTLTNTGNASLTISNVSVAGAGFSGTGVTNGTVLAPGQSATLTVTFAPTVGGAVSSASVSLTSNATTSPVNVGLSGMGEHSVVLTWNASPTGGVTYNVFRGISSGSEGASAINPSPITALTYTDTNVSAGANYYYTVKALDSGGTSAPSNEAPADVPNP
jgi:fibronectin type 3 domain-containing protein